MPPVTARLTIGLAALLLVLTLGEKIPLAQGLDPHTIYERRCAGCHEDHAVDFVQDGLRQTNGKIVGAKRGKELRAFLAGGHGRLSPEEVDVVVDHLTAVLNAGGLYRAKCFICHGPGVSLARHKLLISNGRLMGRYTGRDMASFMQHHGRLSEGEVNTILEMFERQLITRGTR